MGVRGCAGSRDEAASAEPRWLRGPVFGDGQVGELGRGRENLGHQLLDGLLAFSVPRILLTLARLLLALEHCKDLGRVEVVLVVHEQLPHEARPGLFRPP